jgi:hypothetical protein
VTPSSHVLGEPPLKVSLENSGYTKPGEIQSGGNLTSRHGIIGIKHYMKGNIKSEHYRGFGQNLQSFNSLNAELNPFCHLLALLGAHHILHVSRIRVK